MWTHWWTGLAKLGGSSVSLDDLYREVILDHYRNPRRRGRLDHPDAHAEGQNPLCGDEVTIDLTIEDDRVTDVAVAGRGCSISQASASMMAEAINGRTLAQIGELAHRFKVMMEIESDSSDGGDASAGRALGDLEALAGVRRFPIRIKCADLPWATLAQALEDRSRA
jgi:nitrogen fixation NifU-like protein